MSTLDKSLDEIISSTKKPRKFGAKGGKPNKVGKKVGGTSTKKPIVSFKKSPAAALVAAKKAATVDLSVATKVVVHNLPRDLKQDNIKDFFQSQVGPVQNISLNYNEKGQFKGIATIIFKNSKSAAIAVTKYNGAPIDGGSSKLKLELIVDPTKKSLASRITANAPAAKPKIAAAKKQLKAVKAKQGPAKPKAKPVKKTKKTVEELDQEMADYFEA